MAVPVALSDGAQFLPFIDPGFGYGHLSGGTRSQSGVRPMLGGGVMLAGLGRRVSIDVAVQKIFIRDGDVTFGVGLSIAGAPK